MRLLAPIKGSIQRLEVSSAMGTGKMCCPQHRASASVPKQVPLVLNRAVASANATSHQAERCWKHHIGLPLVCSSMVWGPLSCAIETVLMCWLLLLQPGLQGLQRNPQ